MAFKGWSISTTEIQSRSFRWKTIFWNSERILLIDYKSNYYNTGILCWYLTSFEKKIKPGEENWQKITLTSRQCTALQGQNSAMTLCSFKKVVHPPYCPDLVPLNYCLYPNLKKELRGSILTVMSDLLHFTGKDKNHYFWTAGIENLIEKCKKWCWKRLYWKINMGAAVCHPS